MPSADYLIGPARGEIHWYPAIDGQPPVDPPYDEPGPWPWSEAVCGLAEAASIKKIASSLPRGDLRSQLEAGAAQVHRSHPRAMVRHPRDVARARPASLVDRDCGSGRSDGELTTGRFP